MEFAKSWSFLLLCALIHAASGRVVDLEKPTIENGLTLPTQPDLYQSDWESLRKRPMPAWFDTAKFGIFIHWGVYSVPAVTNEWFWHNWITDRNPEAVKYMEKFYPSNFQYADFAKEFTAAFFDPNEWADLLKASGAKYMVITSKHHDGYTLWPSKRSHNWNAKAVGPGRDLIDELFSAIRNRTDLKAGLYYSLFEWYHPLYLQDKANGFQTQEYPQTKMLPEMREMVELYKPDLVWADGEWEAESTYFKSTDFLSWLYNESPVKDHVVCNDRWGNETFVRCGIAGDYASCNDSYDPGHLIHRKWENCQVMDTYMQYYGNWSTWGYRRNMKITEVLSIQEIITKLARAVSCGGNMLLNIGPQPDGIISPIFQERLLQIGAWLKVHGEAIYETIPWKHQNDTFNTKVWYTQGHNGVVYAIILDMPNREVKLASPKLTQRTTITVLGHNETLPSGVGQDGLVTIRLPSKDDLPRETYWSFVLKMVDVEAA